jgi:hypothetical protein
MIRSFQWDLARQVERLDWLLAQLPRYAEWGYQELHLHLEDAVEYPSLPKVARKDAYTYKQFGQLVDAASRVGIKVVPIVNLLGHTQYLIKVPELRDLNELRAADGSPLEVGQICPLHPRTLDVAEKLLRDMAPFCTAGKIHVGLDESFRLGKHPLSKKEIRRIGLGGHFARYVQRLHGLVQSLGLKMSLWGDMLYFLPDSIPQLPPGITIYEWYYYSFERRPKVEIFNFVEIDIATPLKKRGIQLYGCPMSGAFRYEPLPLFHERLENIIAWWNYCRRIGAAGFLVSSWEPYRLAIELTTAVDAAAATLWLEPEVTDPKKMLEKGFERVFGKRGPAAARLALACDRHPFGGYPRWQINERWDSVSRREDLKPYLREASHFTKLAASAKRQNTPPALRASLDFRHALAVRDVTVRQLARATSASFQNTGSKIKTKRASASADSSIASTLERLSICLRKGKRAARTMWTRTRDPAQASPNEAILQRDELRLRALKRGEPVFGGSWQLCYQVWNFAPALQRVGVEQLGIDGAWTTLQSCLTIEFQAHAANQRSDFIREHAAPVEWTGDHSQPPRLRVFIRGVGQVKVGRIVLMDTSRSFAVKSRQTWALIGKLAPMSGLPELDWKTNQGELALAFLL